MENTSLSDRIKQKQRELVAAERERARRVSAEEKEKQRNEAVFKAEQEKQRDLEQLAASNWQKARPRFRAELSNAGIETSLEKSGRLIAHNCAVSETEIDIVDRPGTVPYQPFQYVFGAARGNLFAARYKYTSAEYSGGEYGGTKTKDAGWNYDCTMISATGIAELEDFLATLVAFTVRYRSRIPKERKISNGISKFLDFFS